MWKRKRCEKYAPVPEYPGVPSRDMKKPGWFPASGKNKYGHLLYDQAAEERIRNIRFYQQIGFPVREISGIIDASIPVKRKALKNRIKALKREQDELKRLIEKALKLLDSLS